MGRRLRAVFVYLAVATVVASPSTTAAQLPFDLTATDLAQVDTAVMRWLDIRTYVGGAEGSLSYGSGKVEPGVCRAAAVVGVARLRAHHRELRGSDPVTLRLAVRCGGSYRASMEYDGVILRLEVRDLSRGALVYQGRRRGLL